MDRIPRVPVERKGLPDHTLDGQGYEFPIAHTQSDRYTYVATASTKLGSRQPALALEVSALRAGPLGD